MVAIMADERFTEKLAKQAQQLEAANAGLQQRVAELEREKTTLAAQLKIEHDKSLHKHVQQIDRLNADIQILREHIGELAGDYASLKSSHLHSTEIKDMQAAQILSLQNDAQQLQGINKALNKESVDLTESHAKLRKELQEAQLKLADLRDFYQFLNAQLGEEKLKAYREEFVKSQGDKKAGRNFTL